jgi:hypothetical protein
MKRINTYLDCEEILGDYFLHLFNSQFGKIKKIDQNMAVYRYGGAWSGNNNMDEKTIIVLNTYRNAIREVVPNKQLVDIYYDRLIYIGQTPLKHKIKVDSDFAKKLLDLYEVDSIINNTSFMTLIKSIYRKFKRKIVFV